MAGHAVGEKRLRNEDALLDRISLLEHTLKKKQAENAGLLARVHDTEKACTEANNRSMKHLTRAQVLQRVLDNVCTRCTLTWYEAKALKSFLPDWEPDATVYAGEIAILLDLGGTPHELSMEIAHAIIACNGDNNKSLMMANEILKTYKDKIGASQMNDREEEELSTDEDYEDFPYDMEDSCQESGSEDPSSGGEEDSDSMDDDAREESDDVDYLDDDGYDEQV